MSRNKEVSYKGGVDELGAVEESVDAHQAVGRWWAKAILSPDFDNGADDPANLMARVMAAQSSLGSRDDIESKVGGFAEALGDLSRERELGRIGVDYHPDQVLMEAAQLAELQASDMTTFPWKSSTSIQDGVAYAQQGYDKGYEQIWPPAAE